VTYPVTLFPGSGALPGLAGLAGQVTAEDEGRVAMPGTDRAWPVDATLAHARRCGRAVGITRLADVTRLDRIGIPTWQAIRPASTTLTVSQGKGLTDGLAMVSALMESIEFWHAENAAVDRFTDTIRGLGPALTYDPYTLPLEERHLLHDGLPLDWVLARRLSDGRAVPVPARMVGLDFGDPAGWLPRAFQETSNGLASGNTLVEATLHALYEVIERDALGRATGGTRFDPRSLGSPAVDELLDRFEAAAVTVDVRALPTPAGLPCVTARIVSEDYQILAGGHGCHLKAEIATTRALTEAAQSRLTLISGSRDDLARRAYRPVRRMAAAARDLDPALHPLPPWFSGSACRDSLVADLADLNQRCTSVFGAPLLVDLTRPEIGIPVVHVIVPGCQLDEGVIA
jgi:ribosomal protein S12 methylthiotransferase accessory factor